MSEDKPNQNAENKPLNGSIERGSIIDRISIGGTLPNDAKPVTIQPADIYPSNPALLRNVAQQKFADAWRGFWHFPQEFDPVSYAQGASSVSVTLPPISDQRHVIEQIMFSVADDSAQVLSITDGQDVIFRMNVSMPTNGGWDYITFSPFRMQRVANQQMVITLTNTSTLATLFVNSWRF